ncbi:MAG: hypothetical protein ABR497_08420 [Kiritimatiellia bacterium]|nr:GNAT family N-acetyltransferase [Lentisphaerota bacterium]
MLLEAFLGQLRRAVIPGVHAGVRTDNLAAMRFFERHGFQELSRVPLMRRDDGLLLLAAVLGLRLNGEE